MRACIIALLGVLFSSAPAEAMAPAHALAPAAIFPGAAG